MATRDPISRLATHEVANQPPPLVDYNLFASDPILRDTVHREGAAWADQRLDVFGAARLGEARGLAYGAMPSGLRTAEIIDLARVSG